MKKALNWLNVTFFKEIPAGSDVFLFSNILHDWPDKACKKILRNCQNATKPDGKILIIETIVPQGNEFSIAKLLDLEVLLMGGGKERTEEEYKCLLEQSGFHMSNVLSTRESVSIIEGVPV